MTEQSPKLSDDGLSLRLESDELREVEEHVMNPITEGKIRKGGQNLNAPTQPRPAPPIGQGGTTHRAILSDRKPETTERSGFDRRPCIRGSGKDEHPVGTKAGCPACEAYKASAVVRK